MSHPGHCAHCNQDHNCFARSRRTGHTIPPHTVHRFNSQYTRICSACNAKIKRNPNDPCDICRQRSPALSDALLIAADAARQQLPSPSTTVHSSIPSVLSSASPITSSVLLPANIVSDVITPREKVAFCILVGLTYNQHKEFALFTGGSMSKYTWYTHQREVLNAIETIEKNAEEDITNDIKLRGRWTAVADGGWSQRRNASHHAFIIMDAQFKIIVHSEIIEKELKKQIKKSKKKNSNSDENKTNLNSNEEEEHRMITVQKGNYEGSSQGMEGEAFKRCLDWLQDKGILHMMSDFVSDQSTTVEKLLREDPRTRHVHIWNDPGHMALNFKKHLDNALGQSKLVKGMSSRMEGWFLTSVKLAEQESDERRPAEILQSFTRRMSHFMWHYTGLCMPGCPHEEQEAINRDLQQMQQATSSSSSQSQTQSAMEWSVENAEKEQQKRQKTRSVAAQPNARSSVSLSQAPSNPTSAAIKHIFNFDSGERTRLPVKDDRTMKVYNAYKTVMEKAPRFCHGFNSCAVESQHNKRTKYASKRLSLPTSFANRSRTAVLGQNERSDFKLAVCDVLGIHFDDERRAAIRRYEETQLTALAKKRSADVVLRANTRNIVRKRQRIETTNRDARAVRHSVRNVAAAAPPVTVSTAPPVVNNDTDNGDDDDMYET